MPLIDDRGRLFGRVNVIDATIVAFLLVLLPIVYTASRLFRVPKPEIERIEPATQVAGPGVRIRVHGRNFRPLMRALTSQTGQPFSILDPSSLSHSGNVLLETPSLIEVRLPDLAIGSYDLHIFDTTQEVARLEHAFSLTAPPDTSSLVHARVRVVVPAELTRLVHEGDVEAFEAGAESAGAKATLTHVRVMREGLPPTIDFRDGWGAALMEVEMDLPARQNARGEWEYRDQILRVGERIAFQTPAYSMRGTIGEMRVAPRPPAADQK